MLQRLVAIPQEAALGGSRSGEHLVAQNLLTVKVATPQGSAKVICQCLVGEEPSLPLLEEIN